MKYEYGMGWDAYFGVLRMYDDAVTTAGVREGVWREGMNGWRRDGDGWMCS